MSFSYSAFIKHWNLDKTVCFLNHGSFGATPIEILKKQQELLYRMEEEPVRFMVREAEERWDDSRRIASSFVGGVPENFVFVRNATAGVNVVLNSLSLGIQDEVLITNHTYGACVNTLKELAETRGFSIRVVELKLPIESEDQILSLLEDATTSKTKLLLIDHITSPTAIVFPIEKIVKQFEEKGIEVLVDGAHGPGMIDLKLEQLGASYYVGNFHKWVCAPKGVAFLYVRQDRKKKIKPLQKSHYYLNSDNEDFWANQFFWPGTDDFTSAFLSPESIRFMENLFEGGWPAIREHNNTLTLLGKNILEQKFFGKAPVPSTMLGSMAIAYLGEFDFPTLNFNKPNPLQNKLFFDYNIEVPIVNFPSGSPHYYVRISAQVYNHISQYEYLANALQEAVLSFQKG